MKIPRKEIKAFRRHHALALANIASVMAQPFASEQPSTPAPGEIYLANESQFGETYFNEPLTQYAVGWKDDSGLEEALEFFAPEVSTARWFTYKSFTNIEQFLSDGTNDDLRGIGAEFTRVQYTGSNVTARTDNRGLTIRVDLDQVSDKESVLAGGLPAYQAREVAKLKERSIRNDFRRAIALLVAAATNTNVTWSGQAVDADMVVLNDMITGANARGLMSNRVGYGQTAWALRLGALRALNVAGGYANAGFTPTQVGEFLGIDELLVNRSRYSQGGGALAQVIGNLIIQFYALKGASTEDPTNIKRFTSPTDAGGPFRVFVQQVTSKLVDITVERYNLISITSTLGIRTHTVS